MFPRADRPYAHHAPADAPRVLGVDGCPGGWVGVAPDPDRVRAYAAPTLEALVAAASADGAPACVAVDIPIGLADAGPRAADLAAKAALGSRGSSLFMTPVRAALELNDYPTAVALNRERTGVGFSRQAWGLREKILEVDAFWARTPCPLIEAHPELTLTTMTGAPLTAGKKTWAGAVVRLAALAAEGIVLGPDLGPGLARAGVDDVIDAAAVAWTARRYVAGQAVSRPAAPEMLRGAQGKTIRAAIWS